MSWLRYYPNVVVPPDPSPEDFRYPYVRRKISQFTPFDDIPEGTWLYCNLDGSDVDRYYDGTSSSSGYTVIADPTSYVVVYDPVAVFDTQSAEDPPVVDSVVIDDKLYFKAFKDHSSGNIIDGVYTVYYRTPGLKTFLNETVTSPSVVDRYSFSVLPQSNFKYGFSFVNADVNWINGETSFPLAKAYGTFSGDSFKLIGEKDPSGGMFRIRFTSISSQFFTPEEIVEVEDDLDHESSGNLVVEEDRWIIVDTYAQQQLPGQVLFEYSEFEDKNYSFELEVLEKKNVLSSGNRVVLEKYEFSYNPFLELRPEEIDTELHVYTQIKTGT